MVSTLDSWGRLGLGSFELGRRCRVPGGEVKIDSLGFRVKIDSLVRFGI